MREIKTPLCGTVAAAAVRLLLFRCQEISRLRNVVTKRDTHTNKIQQQPTTSYDVVQYIRCFTIGNILPFPQVESNEVELYELNNNYY